MWLENYSNSSILKTDLVEITNNYTVLHFDDFPILYFGTNKFDNKIIGSHLDEDDTNKFIWSLHTIITDKEYNKFINRKISYLDILKSSNSICLVRKGFNLKTQLAFDINYNDVDKEYLPQEDSFCPILDDGYSLNFSLSLKGKLADLNKVLADEVSKIQVGFSEFLEDRVKNLKGFNYNPQTFLQPYSEGSFKINVELALNQKTKKPNLFIGLAPIEKYLTYYIKYLTQDFAIDKDTFKSDTADKSENFHTLKKTLEDVFEKAQVIKPDDFVKTLTDDLIKSANKFEKMTEQVGEHFRSIEINNFYNNSENTIAFLDNDFSNNIQASLEDIEISKKGVIVDDDYKTYKIYIYQLNTDTRSGNALIQNSDNDHEMSKPKIKILGEDGLDQSKYTESIHLNKWINVKAKAKKIGNKFKQLEIEFEQ